MTKSLPGQTQVKSLLGDFKKFISRGNVVDLAVGVMIGAAFQSIVKAFTDGIVTPLLNAVGGKPDVPLTIWHFNLGLVISAIISFLITAATIFFLIVKPMGKLMEATKKKEEAEEKAEKAEEEEREAAELTVLKEIRDYLKLQADEPPARTPVSSG